MTLDRAWTETRGDYGHELCHTDNEDFMKNSTSWIR